MRYDEALQRWGARQLAQPGWDVDTTSVSVTFAEVKSCCDDWQHCYCTDPNGPSAEVTIRGQAWSDHLGMRIGPADRERVIDRSEMDFVAVLREIGEIADGGAS